MRNFRWEHVDCLEAVHAKLKVPALLIWGARDTFFPLDKARAMLPQFAAGAHLEVFERGRLFVHEDHAAAFAALVSPFLSGRFER